MSGVNPRGDSRRDWFPRDLPPRPTTATCYTEIQGLSLINFHRILIAVAILFCAGYGAYELVAFARDGGNGTLAISGFFFVSTIALTYYLWHLKRILGVEE